MSVPNYYGQPPIQYHQPMILPHRGGLSGWGTVLIVIGSIAGLLAMMALMGLVFMVTLGKRMAVPSRSVGAAVAGALIEAVVSAVLISVGVGTTRGRRWVGPLVSACCAVTIAASGGSLVSYTLMAAHALTLPNTPIPGSPFPQKFFTLGVAVGSAAFAGGLGIVLPFFMFRFFNRETVRQTLAQMDPQPRWTDRLPLPLLVWIVGCVVGGAGLASSSMAGIFPFFLGILEGFPAVLASFCIGGAMVAGGLLCLRRSTAGWAMSLAAVGLVAASTAVFSVAGDSKAYKRALTHGMDTAQQHMTADMLPNHLMVSSALIYAAAVFYGSWVRGVLKQESPFVTTDALPIE